MWQTVSKHQIHCCCAVSTTQKAPFAHNSSTMTEGHQIPQRLPHSSQKPAHRGNCFSPPLFPPTAALSPLFSLSSCSHPVHACHCNHNHMCIYKCVSTHMHMQVRWEQRFVSTRPCQLQYHVQAQNTHIIPCVQCLFLHTTATVVCYCMITHSNVKRVVALWQRVKNPWVEKNNILSPVLWRHHTVSKSCTGHC